VTARAACGITAQLPGPRDQTGVGARRVARALVATMACGTTDELAGVLRRCPLVTVATNNVPTDIAGSAETKPEQDGQQQAIHIIDTCQHSCLTQVRHRQTASLFATTNS
jgi:hypothetical protein